MQSSKTVVITGASSGIGLALATAFARNGARVVANSRHITQSHTLTPSPDLVLVARVIEAADRFGGVDLLVNNAGVFIAKPFGQYTAEALAVLVSTNVAGFFHV